MKIGILSDTHGFFHPGLKEAFCGVDYILHAGDVGARSVLESLSAIAPVVAVRGNIDGEEFFDEPAAVTRDFGGFGITMTHNAGDLLHPAYDLRSRIIRANTDILISGHYHAYWCSQISSRGRNVLWLSPGAAGNAGHHSLRMALILTLPDAACGDWLHECRLQKVDLGARGMAQEPVPTQLFDDIRRDGAGD